MTARCSASWATTRAAARRKDRAFTPSTTTQGRRRRHAPKATTASVVHKPSGTRRCSETPGPRQICAGVLTRYGSAAQSVEAVQECGHCVTVDGLKRTIGPHAAAFFPAAGDLLLSQPRHLLMELLPRGHISKWRHRTGLIGCRRGLELPPPARGGARGGNVLRLCPNEISITVPVRE